MTATVDAAGGQTLTPLSAAVDSLLVSDLGRLSQDELLDAVRGMESESRRLAAVQHRLTAEVAARNVAGELKYRDTASLLSAVLLLTRSQASERVHAAEALEPRASLLGEPLPPVLPATASALTKGTIGVCQESWTDPRLLIMQRLLRFGIRSVPRPTQRHATAAATPRESRCRL
jgi:hypothetical protein